MNSEDRPTLGGLAGLFPLVYTRSGHLAAGHQRYQAAKELGVEWPTVMVVTEDNAAILRMALASNIQKPLSDREQEALDTLGPRAARLLEPAAAGVRPLDPAHVRALARSVAAWGYQDYPWWAIIRDQHGRILSGRHRIAVAHLTGVNWRVVTLEVADDAAALEIACTANIHWGLAPKDLERLGKKLGHLDYNAAIRAQLERGRRDGEIARSLWDNTDNPSLAELRGLVGRIRRAKENADLVPFAPRPIAWRWITPPLQPTYEPEGEV